MQFLRPKSVFLYFVVASVILFTNAAHALEGKALWEKLVAEYKDVAKISWESMSEESSSTFTLQGLKIATVDGPETNIEAAIFQDFTESDNGYLSLGGFDLRKISSKQSGKPTTTVNSLSGKTIKLPALILTGQLTEELAEKRISFNDLSVNAVLVEDANSVFKIDNVSMTKADVPLKYNYEANAETVGQIAPPLKFETFSLGAMSGAKNGVEWSLASASMEKASLPTTYLGTTAEWMQIYSSMSLQKFVINLGTTELFRLDSLTGQNEKSDADGILKTASQYDGMVINLKAIPHSQTNLIANQLGYDVVESTMTGSGSYNPSNGRLTLNDFTVDFKEMATLSMKYALSGYTEQVAGDMQKMQRAMMSGKPVQQALEPYNESLSKIVLESFNLTLTDNSLTGRVLDFQGKQMGMSGDQLAQGAPMFVGMGMAGLEMPEFTEMVTKAVGSFLQNKGSLSVETQLQEPVSIIEMVKASEGDPKKIPELLKLKVSGE